MPGRMRYADLNFLAPENEVHITGISGRFSEAAHLEEFYENLVNHVDMVTDDERRYPRKSSGIHVAGKIKEVDKFDSQFFGQTAKYVEVMSPEMRMSMELVYETIVDAGLSLEQLRETRTGVYVAGSTLDSFQSHLQDVDNVKANVYIGNNPGMIANKISNVFALNGPSMSMDSACSSTLYCIDEALRAIRTGVIDQALVGAIVYYGSPYVADDFSQNTMSKKWHRCKAFDASGDGYVRGETGAYLLLQRREDSRRSYARLVHARTNVDGKSETGFLAPWGKRQYELVRDTIQESGIDAKEIEYLECHGTGTTAGDPQEIIGLTTNGLLVAGRDKDRPLLIGSVKSNCGHGEHAAAMASMAKIIVTLKHRTIPANLHYQTPNPKIPALINGQVKVVAENTDYNGGYIGINSFGLGGSNGHLIVRDTDTHSQAPSKAGSETRLFTYATRTEEGANHILEFVQKHCQSLELHTLLHPSAAMDTFKMPVRCYAVLNGKNEYKAIEQPPGEKPPVWFLFPGMGCQWTGMGQNMMKLPMFRETIQRLSAYTKDRFEVDLLKFFKEPPHEGSLDKTMPVIPLTAVQIALINILQAVGLEPDGMLGHSNGEVACGYADGCLTEEQAITVACVRSMAGKKSLELIGIGKMAAVGMTWEECKRRCPPGVYAACHNAHDSVTISGVADGVDKMMAELQREGKFAREVASAGMASHRPEWQVLDEIQREIIEPMIPNPKRRSSKWISTCFEGDDLALPVAQTASTEYFLSNSNKPVLFHQAVLQIPRGAIVLEIGSRALLSSVVKRTMKNELTPLALMKQDHDDNVGFCLSNLGKCYLQGVDINPLALLPPVQFPVPLDTPMLSSTLSTMWDHSVTWPAPKYSDYCHSGDTTDFRIDLAKGREFSNMMDHEVDGVPVLTESVYVFFAWRALAKKLRKEIVSLPVEFTDVTFLKRTNLALDAPVTLKVRVSVQSGMFEVCNTAEDLVCTGRVTQLPINTEAKPELKENGISADGSQATPSLDILDKRGFYRLQKPSGYNRRGAYQTVAGATLNFSEFTLEWEGDWIRFVDAMTQAAMCALRPRNTQERVRLRLAGFGRLTIDPSTMQNPGDGVKGLRAVTNLRESKLTCNGVMLQHVQTVYEMTPGSGHTSLVDSYCFVPHTVTVANGGTPNGLKEDLLETDQACLGIDVQESSNTLNWRLSLEVALPHESSSAMTIMCAGLYPSDMATATGKLTIAALYSPEVSLLGRDAAGYLGDGRRVMAALPAACRTQAAVTDDLVLDVPAQWTLDQAATVPTAYSTAYYVCQVKSRLRPGDTILVMDMLHPVGQAVVNLARHSAVNVIGLVQDDICRRLVLNNFPEFPHTNVVCRDGKEVWIQRVAELASEEGVDMIVTTLTEPVSISALATLNREGTVMQVGDHALDDVRKSYFRDEMQISVHKINMPHILYSKTEKTKSIRKELALMMKQGIQDGAVQPLNRAVFEASELETVQAALRAESWTKSLVVRVQEERKSTTHSNPPSVLKIAVPKRFRCESTRSYLLVGQLDGFGIDVARWLVTRGARHLLLPVRKEELSGYQKYRVNQMVDSGAEVKFTSESSLTLKGAKQLVREVSEMRPLGGLFVIDTNHTDLSRDENEKSVRNLDQATRDLQEVYNALFVACSPLEDGRAVNDTTLTNNFPISPIEEICKKRKDDNKHGLAIRWGPIECDVHQDSSDSKSYIPLTVESSIQALDKALCQDTSVVDIYRRQERGQEVIEQAGAHSDAKALTLTDHVLAILGLKKQPTEHMTLLDAGIDSLGTTEVAQMLEKMLGVSMENAQVRALTFKRLKEMQQ